MTRKEALRVLFRAALRHCEGSGVGLRVTPTDEQKREVVAAAKRLWGEAYGIPLDAEALYQYGLSELFDGAAPAREGDHE